MKRKISEVRFFILIIPAIVSFTLSCSEPNPAETYALVYGVADYLYDENNYLGQNFYLPDLNLTDDDAQSVADLLESKGWNVTLRFSTEVTITQIQADIDAYAAIMDENDRLLFYYSGHGGEVNDSYWIFPYDVASLDYTETAINSEKLKTMLESSGAGLITVILDSCNSGGFVDNNITVDYIPADFDHEDENTISFINESFSIYLTGAESNASYTVLSAAGANEESLEKSEYGHGIFTYFLLQTAQYADYNFDGYITMTEAFAFTAWALEYYNNYSYYIDDVYDIEYYPHVSAFPVDPLLFEAD